MWLFIALSWLPSTALAAPAQPQPLKQLDWLVGGVWTADASQLPGGLKRIETRYRYAADKCLIRFTTEFIAASGAAVNRYAGDVYYDAPSNRLEMWYISSENEITQGTIALNGDGWQFAFESPGAIVGKNGLVNFHTDVLHPSADAYQWKLSAEDGSAWKPVFALTYVRTPEAS